MQLTQNGLALDQNSHFRGSQILMNLRISITMQLDQSRFQRLAIDPLSILRKSQERSFVHHYVALKPEQYL